MTSRLVAFVEGSGTDSQGRRLSDIWQFDDDTIDFTHDFIQWMFPLRGQWFKLYCANAVSV